MDQEIIAKNRIEDQTTSPEEDSKLLAIEALEARTIDPNPRPLNDPEARDVPVPARVAPAAPKPEVIKPIEPKPIADVTHVTPPPAVVKQVPPQPQVKPVQGPIIPPKPKKKNTPSEEMAEELATAPTTTGFQFFASQRSARKPFIIIGTIVVVVAVGASAYFLTR